MYCKLCGVLLQDDSIYCRICGDRIRPKDMETDRTQACAFCESILLPAARFCITCGKPVASRASLAAKKQKPKTVVCPDCGKILEADVRFCVYCGADTKPSASDETAEIEPWLDIEDAPVLVIPGVQTADTEPTAEELAAQTVEELPSLSRPLCPQCGKSLESHMIYCIFCGERVRRDEHPGIGSPSEFFSKLTADEKPPQRCPFCYAQVKDKQRFCVKCGAFVAQDALRTGEIAPRNCNSCGKPLKPGARFCVFCGIPITE